MLNDCIDSDPENWADGSNSTTLKRPLWSRDPDRNSKVVYYTRQFSHLMIPNGLYRKRMYRILERAGETRQLCDRLTYYNKIDAPFSLDENHPTIRQFRKVSKKTYFFDLYEYLRTFPENNRLHFLFGDIQHVPSVPCLLKSRPIAGENANGVLMKLNKVRHFNFVKDGRPFSEKKDLLVWRGKAKQEHRKEFLRRFYDHPLCDVGNAWRSYRVPYAKPWMSLREQLAYKFILAIEGYDVASNLKWILSSNSLAVMPRPRFETWFMEGRLLPDHHYVLVKDDYSDLEEKLRYYSRRPREAQFIIDNANAHVSQFLNPLHEDALSLLTLHRYFDLSGQPTGPLMKRGFASTVR
jgi:hypothetical protein